MESDPKPDSSHPEAGPKGVRCSVIVAEDDDDDFLLTEKAFQESGWGNSVRRVLDGEELIGLLESEARGAPPRSRPPLIVLLDLNMPRLDGRETLRRLKAHPVLRRVPVIVLTNSDLPQDISLVYELGAASYIRKPSGFRAFVELAGRVRDYWQNSVEFPTWGGPP